MPFTRSALVLFVFSLISFVPSQLKAQQTPPPSQKSDAAPALPPREDETLADSIALARMVLQEWGG